MKLSTKNARKEYDLPDIVTAVAIRGNDILISTGQWIPVTNFWSKDDIHATLDTSSLQVITDDDLITAVRRPYEADQDIDPVGFTGGWTRSEFRSKFVKKSVVNLK